MIASARGIAAVSTSKLAAPPPLPKSPHSCHQQQRCRNQRQWQDSSRISGTTSRTTRITSCRPRQRGSSRTCEAGDNRGVPSKRGSERSEPLLFLRSLIRLPITRHARQLRGLLSTSPPRTPGTAATSCARRGCNSASSTYLPRNWLDMAGSRVVDSRGGPDLASLPCGAVRRNLSTGTRAITMRLPHSARIERLTTPINGADGGRSAPPSS